MGSGAKGVVLRKPGLIHLLGEELLVPAHGMVFTCTPGSIFTVIRFVPFLVGSWRQV